MSLPFESQALRPDDDGQEVLLLGEGDLFKRKAVFEMLFQAYLRLQETNKRKTAMVAAATHEVKTPLAIMAGACELLLGDKVGPLSPAQREIVALFYKNCDRLIKVVNSFLLYSGAEHGKLALHLESLDVAPLLDETAEYWKEMGSGRQVSVSSAITPGLPQLMGDRSKLQTVLNSLCDNALKFSPAGGRISMTADLHFWERRWTLAQIAEERRNEHVNKPNSVRVSVADNGPGIPPEFQQDVFNEYFQVPGNSKAGMGLGLAIAREIVSAHNGKIWVESQPGHGATFHFVLPLD